MYFGKTFEHAALVDSKQILTAFSSRFFILHFKVKYLRIYFYVTMFFPLGILSNFSNLNADSEVLMWANVTFIILSAVT